MMTVNVGKARSIGGNPVGAIGLGCMNLSHAYGHPPQKSDAIRLLHQAFDLGVRHFDTAALYGFGSNEVLVGEALADRRDAVFLASKCGMTGVDGKRVIDGRPETLSATVDKSLRSLRTDHLDLYYLHRWDRDVPIEDSVGALSRMVEEGKVLAIGLSEVSAATLRRASDIHPIAAIQTEYSLWTRNAEIAVLNACRELDVAFVAFSPLARGFLAGGVGELDDLAEKDIRRSMPRFQAANYNSNMALYETFASLADEAGCTPAQLALAWVLAQGDFVIPIPGTRSSAHLTENTEAANIHLSEDVLERAGALINQQSVSGARYPAATQSEIDTEEF